MMRPYTDADFLRVRDFLVATYGHYRRSYNWTIERWNFSASVARSMNGVSLDRWASQIGIWDEDSQIRAVVNAEGEDRGEAYFQLAHEHLPEALLLELFDFCEARLGKAAEGGRRIELFLPSGDVRLETLAQRRGFARQAGHEDDGVLELGSELPGSLPVVLPPGYAFADGTTVTPEEKGDAHARGFGYAGEPVYPARAVEGFRLMAKMPDYRADLNLHVRAPSGEIAAFATMWYDACNRIGILEPVATAPEYRRLGLGRAAIYELINRVRREGATRVHVGSGQVFYQRLGFVVVEKYSVWQKVVA